MTRKMTLSEWLDYGKDLGYCSDPVCDTHQGLPYSDPELEEFEAGGDPCMTGVRIYGIDSVGLVD